MNEHNLSSHNPIQEFLDRVNGPRPPKGLPYSYRQFCINNCGPCGEGPRLTLHEWPCTSDPTRVNYVIQYGPIAWAASDAGQVWREYWLDSRTHSDGKMQYAVKFSLMHHHPEFMP